MPEEHYTWIPRDELLTFEEIALVARAFAACGVRKLRLTGGEPLLRRDLPRLLKLLAGVEGIEALALTTNGVLMREYAGQLRRAGLQRVTFSLDTLRPDRFGAIAGRGELRQVLEGIEAARQAGFERIKLNTVVTRGLNDDEVADIVRFAHERQLEPRFIEYMDVGGATHWASARVVPFGEILARIEHEFGRLTSVDGRGSAPAEQYRLESGRTVGMISSTTRPFCGTCDRGRLTADGVWYLCLYARQGTDFRALVRSGAGLDELAEQIRTRWPQRDDRGAEVRAETAHRTAFVPLSDLKRDYHLEMHTRGG
jgi:cyclic pyranopterin phosphate synthase